MPKPDGSPSAVVVSGGKQYLVVPGDRILVDRLAAEPGAAVKLGRVLLLNDGGEVKLGSALDGLDVDAKVIDHRRGPRIESLRYKSKKRVRVHHGGRAYLTALEIIAVGGVGPAVEEEKDEDKVKPRGRAKAAPRKKAAPKSGTKAESKAEVAAEPAAKQTPAPKKAAPRRRAAKENE